MLITCEICIFNIVTFTFDVNNWRQWALCNHQSASAFSRSSQASPVKSWSVTDMSLSLKVVSMSAACGMSDNMSSNAGDKRFAPESGASVRSGIPLPWFGNWWRGIVMKSPSSSQHTVSISQRTSNWSIVPLHYCGVSRYFYLQQMTASEEGEGRCTTLWPNGLGRRSWKLQYAHIQ